MGWARCALPGGGRPRRIDEPTRERIRAIALARPRDLGEPGTRWSLTTLRRYLVRHWVVVDLQGASAPGPVDSMGITAQRTRTWKWSNDPLFEAKKQWVLAAYKAAEAGTLDGVLGQLRRVRPDLTEAPRRVGAGSRRADRPASGPPTTPRRGAKAAGRLRRGRRPTVGPARGPPGDRPGGAGVPQRHPSALPARVPGLHRDGQPLRPLDPGDPPTGRWPTTSGCCPPRLTPVTSTASSATSGRTSSSSSTAATTPTGRSSPKPARPTSAAATATTTTPAS